MRIVKTTQVPSHRKASTCCVAGRFSARTLIGNLLLHAVWKNGVALLMIPPPPLHRNYTVVPPLRKDDTIQDDGILIFSQDARNAVPRPTCSISESLPAESAVCKAPLGPHIAFTNSFLRSRPCDIQRQLKAKAGGAKWGVEGTLAQTVETESGRDRKPRTQLQILRSVWSNHF